MGYKIVKLQNHPLDPTIVISKGDPEWEAAYQEWTNGKNPTNAIDWKKGVFALTELIDE